MAKKTYEAGVKDYAETYLTPDYEPRDIDLRHWSGCGAAEHRKPVIRRP